MNEKFRGLFLYILDRLTKKNGILVDLQGFGLRMPGKYFKFFPTDYEAANFDFYREKIRPGDTCLDIGAHLGAVAVYMAKKCGANVYAFEPTPGIFTTLKNVIRMNDCGALINAIPLAVSDHKGTSTFYINSSGKPGANQERIAEANSLLDVDFGETIKKTGIEINVISIDEFAKANNLAIHFIKIDAEGAEKKILEGAANTMKLHRPSGIVSVHNFAFQDPYPELERIWELMDDYEMALEFEGKPLLKNNFLQMGDRDIFDFQFSPKWKDDNTRAVS